MPWEDWPGAEAETGAPTMIGALCVYAIWCLLQILKRYIKGLVGTRQMIDLLLELILDKSRRVNLNYEKYLYKI